MFKSKNVSDIIQTIKMKRLNIMNMNIVKKNKLIMIGCGYFFIYL